MDTNSLYLIHFVLNYFNINYKYFDLHILSKKQFYIYDREKNKNQKNTDLDICKFQESQIQLKINKILQ